MPQARKRKSSDQNQPFQNHQITINIIISIINNEPFPERHLLPDLFSKPVWIRFLPSLFLLFLLLHLNTRQHGILKEGGQGSMMNRIDRIYLQLVFNCLTLFKRALPSIDILSASPITLV